MSDRSRISDCKYCCYGICCNDSCEDVFGDYPSEEYCLKCERYDKGGEEDDERGISN